MREKGRNVLLPFRQRLGLLKGVGVECERFSHTPERPDARTGGLLSEDLRTVQQVFGMLKVAEPRD